MNKYHLIHSFTKYKGMSPIRYVLEKRLIEAKMLLMTTDLNMGEIADIVGFSSPSYFAQTFKKYVHVSPLQYRKNNSNWSFLAISHKPALAIKKQVMRLTFDQALIKQGYPFIKTAGANI